MKRTGGRKSHDTLPSMRFCMSQGRGINHFFATLSKDCTVHTVLLHLVTMPSEFAVDVSVVIDVNLKNIALKQLAIISLRIKKKIKK